jgi:hypothetical protein
MKTQTLAPTLYFCEKACFKLIEREVKENETPGKWTSLGITDFLKKR